MTSKIKYIILCSVLFLACKTDTSTTAAPAATEIPAKEETATKRQQTNVAAEIAKSTTVKVDTVSITNLEALVENAKSNTVLVLEKGTYHLEKDLVYYITKDERKIIDKKIVETRSIGGQLFISGLTNFQIIGKKGTEIVSKNPKAVALFVLNGKNLKFSKLTIRQESKGQADLCYVSNSQEVLINRCKFDGGGTYGLYVNNVTHLKFNNCKISGCTSGIIRINNSSDINIMNSNFRKNICTVSPINLYGNGSIVTLKNVRIIDNKKDKTTSFENSDRLFAKGGNSIKLENCIIRNNVGFQYLGLSQNDINKSQIEGVIIE